MSQDEFKGIIPKRKLDAHKGTFGHVFVLAGSVGMTGAAYLCSQATLLSGSGLVTLGIPKSLNQIMEIKLTEVMTKPLNQTKQLTLSLSAFAQIVKILPAVNAVAIGPGISRNPETKKLVLKLLLKIDKPMVLDADGINALAGNLKVLDNVKNELIITPHVGELSRLLDIEPSLIQKNRIKTAQDLAQRYNIVVVLKGQGSVVASAGASSYVNRTGNPGMASAGCGDVLTGMIAAFLGQGISAFEAAKLAVYLHGLAADFAAVKKGEISLTALDILEQLPTAFKQLTKA